MSLTGVCSVDPDMGELILYATGRRLSFAVSLAGLLLGFTTTITCSIKCSISRPTADAQDKETYRDSLYTIFHIMMRTYFVVSLSDPNAFDVWIEKPFIPTTYICRIVGRGASLRPSVLLAQTTVSPRTRARTHACTDGRTALRIQHGPKDPRWP